MNTETFIRIAELIMDVFHLNIAANSKKIEGFLEETSTSALFSHHKIIRFIESESGSTLCQSISSLVTTSILDNLKFLSLNHLNEKKEYFSYLKDFLDHKKDLAIQVSEVLLFNIDK